jgi:hypothetical protein
LWSPSLFRAEDGGQMPVNTEERLGLLGRWIKTVAPDVVVISAVRNGLEQRDASALMTVNHAAKTISNQTNAAVLMLDHRNKPNRDALGREAASTVRPADLSTRVARAKGWHCHGELMIHAVRSGADMMPLGALSTQLERGSRLRTVLQFDWGKVRVIEDLHAVHSLAIAQRCGGGPPCFTRPMAETQMWWQASRGWWFLKKH